MTLILPVVNDKIKTYSALIPDWAIANELNAPNPDFPKKVFPKKIGYADILRVLGPQIGGELLMAIEGLQTQPGYEYLKYVFKLLDRDNLDIGDAATRNTIDKLVERGFLTLQSAIAIKGLAEGKHLSWCEAHDVQVDAQIVGLARGGTT